MEAKHLDQDSIRAALIVMWRRNYGLWPICSRRRNKANQIAELDG